MHYGGSTLDDRSERFIIAARLLNELDHIRQSRGVLTAYQEAIRFWATCRIRSSQNEPTKEVHHA